MLTDYFVGTHKTLAHRLNQAEHKEALMRYKIECQREERERAFAFWAPCGGCGILWLEWVVGPWCRMVTQATKMTA